MFSDQLKFKMQKLIKDSANKNLKITTAESCTGGLIAALFTDLPGSSAVFERGYVAYSNKSKIDQLSVPTYFIETYGAVSKEVAVAMAEGAVLCSESQIAVSVTGFAGPEVEKGFELGTVYIAVSVYGKPSICKHNLFSGSRSQIRIASVEKAVDMLIEAVEVY